MALLQTPQNLGRAKNFLQDYFVRKLLVPKVYLDATWNGSHVDVLAIDRAGVGDVHAVKVFPLESGTDVQAAFVLFRTPSVSPVEEFKSIPSHFRYITLVGEDQIVREFTLAHQIIPKFVADDGVGRVGLLYVDPAENDPSVKVILKAERFRSSKEIIEIADRYVAEHTANWEVRDEPGFE